MLYYEKGGSTLSLSDEDIRAAFFSVLDRVRKERKVKRVLALPPDITRFHSRAGDLTVMADEYFGNELTDIMPRPRHAFSNVRSGA